MPRPHSRAAALVWAIIVFPVLLVFVGLTCDTGVVYIVSGQLQTAADASALAAAQHLLSDPDNAQQAALDVAAANYVLNKPMTIAASDVVLGHYTRSPGASHGFHPGATPYNAVKVIARKTSDSPAGSLPLIFGPFVGANSSNVSRSAIAMISDLPAGVIVLDPSNPSSLIVSASGAFNVSNGSIYVNSSNAAAVSMSGSGNVMTNALNIAGSYTDTGSGSIPAVINTGVDPAPDPYATLPLPSIPPNGTFDSTANTYTPGYYSGAKGLNVHSGATLLPGIYYIDGGLNINGSGGATGDGVLLYVNSGPISIGASGPVTLSPQTSGDWQGITIFQAPSNPSVSSIKGSGKLNINGSIYVPNSTLVLQGSGDTLGTAVIVLDLIVKGSGGVNVPVDPSSSTGIPFLVE